MLRKNYTLQFFTSVLAVLSLVALSTPAAAQKRGGVLNWFAYGDPARLDVHTESPLVVQQVTAGIWSGLLQYSPDDPSKVVPDLATSYKVSNKGKTYTFTLRKGVKWHDGKPFTSADVKASLDRIIDPKVKSKKCGSNLRPVIDKVTTKGDYSVRVDLKFSAATFIPAIGSSWCRIAAKHILERDGNLLEAKSQIGTGPFIFKRYDRGSVVEWERNPNYYNPKYPYLDGVKIYIIKGKDRQLAAAKAGQLHLWDTWPPMSKSAADELKAARGDKIKLYQHAINTMWEVHFNTTKKPFSILDMRRAVHLGLDRKELIDKALEGAGVPCAILDPKLHGKAALSLKEIAKTPGCRQDKKAQDIAAAKKLVAKHYPNGVDVDVAVRSVGNYVDRVQLVVSQLRKLGIRGKIKTYESAAGYTAYTQGKFDLIGTQDTAMDLPDPSGPFAILYQTGAGRNYGKWSSKKMDALHQAGLREGNPAKRIKIYQEMQRYALNTDGQVAVIGWVEGWFFTDKKLKNYHPANTIYDNNTFMNVWLEE